MGGCYLIGCAGVS